MSRYIIRRLIQAVPLLFFISIVLFLLMQASGDPLATLGGRQPPRAEDRERLKRQMGLDQPPLMQYFIWLVGNDWMVVNDETGETGTRRGVIRGDFGTSFVTRQPVIEVIWERMPNTLILMGTAEVVIIIVSLTIGVISAVRQYSLLDTVATGFSFVAYSIPVFLMGLMLMYIFAVRFRQWGLPYLPISGMFDPTVGRTFDQIARHLVLPVLTISLISIATYSRYIRSTMLEVINSDYIRTARAKGLSERRTLFVHAFKNASLPIVTLIGLDLPFLLAGAVVTETIFAWPGMGRLFIDHLTRSDYPVLMGLLMMISVAVVFFQLLTDVVYTWLDPRIRYT
ncbi:MAG: ABC transporter permease [Chloroflexi bacterium]|nr:ABC transporter permease [Chloroflexota bacterium]MDL1885676.1 ABC transporter permease [Anaerolineae bacterium CFX8]